VDVTLFAIGEVLPAGTHSTLHFRIDAVVPTDTAGATLEILHLDALKGPGDPIDNFCTYVNRSIVQDPLSVDDPTCPECFLDLGPTCSITLVPRDILTVAKDGSADFTTIQAAIDVAGTDTLIRVLDTALYNEQLVIDESATIEAPGGFGGTRFKGSGPRPTLTTAGLQGIVVDIQAPDVVWDGIDILHNNEPGEVDEISAIFATTTDTHPFGSQVTNCVVTDSDNAEAVDVFQLQNGRLTVHDMDVFMSSPNGSGGAMVHGINGDFLALLARFDGCNDALVVTTGDPEPFGTPFAGVEFRF
jgi:hypothetical protein